jgi:hypothetical protein
MIYRGDPYVTLMASLPAVLFLSEREPPINASRLAERLKDLMPEDQAEIERMRRLIAWSVIDPRLDDAAFVAQAERAIASLRSEALQAAARDRFEIRTLVAALRARHAGEDAPPEGVRWGFGRHVERIRRNWSAPDFGMARLLPLGAQGPRAARGRRHGGAGAASARGRLGRGAAPRAGPRVRSRGGRLLHHALVDRRSLGALRRRRGGRALR